MSFLEARVGIGRLKRRFWPKNGIVLRLIKQNTAATQPSTFSTQLLTFLLTV